MKEAKSKAILSKNPTLDLIFLSKETLTAPDYDLYYDKLKLINKNISQKKCISGIQKKNAPLKRQNIKTEQKQTPMKRYGSLPKLTKIKKSISTLQMRDQKQNKQIKKSQCYSLPKIPAYDVKKPLLERLEKLKTVQSPIKVNVYGTWSTKNLKF